MCGTHDGVNELVNDLARLDEKHDTARLLQRLDHFFDRVYADHVGSCVQAWAASRHEASARSEQGSVWPCGMRNV